jgi:hypothetical protein
MLLTFAGSTFSKLFMTSSTREVMTSLLKPADDAYEARSGKEAGVREMEKVDAAK